MQPAVAGIGNGHLPVQRAFEIIGCVFQKKTKNDSRDNGKKKKITQKKSKDNTRGFCLFVSELTVFSF